MQYIIVSRRSSTSRYLDVALQADGNTIAVFDDDPPGGVIVDETELIEYVKSEDTTPRNVDAALAHSVLGWDIP